MKTLFVLAVVAFAMVQAAPSGWGGLGWGGWNGGWGGHGGWAGHGTVVGPVAGSAVVSGPSGVISSHQSNPGAVVAAAPAWGWNGGHGGWNGGHGAWNGGHGGWW